MSGVARGSYYVNVLLIFLYHGLMMLNMQLTVILVHTVKNKSILALLPIAICIAPRGIVSKNKYWVDKP